MEATIGVVMVLGFLFCFLLWAEIISFGGRRVGMRKIETAFEDKDDDDDGP